MTYSDNQVLQAYKAVKRQLNRNEIKKTTNTLGQYVRDIAEGKFDAKGALRFARNLERTIDGLANYQDLAGFQKEKEIRQLTRQWKTEVRKAVTGKMNEHRLTLVSNQIYKMLMQAYMKM
jgi:phosphate uptake regulator